MEMILFIVIDVTATIVLHARSIHSSGLKTENLRKVQNQRIEPGTLLLPSSV
ncbi:hypothetical protein ANCCEY_15789 [Ancylostoma ceylanicum]|uniref:Uncharacterized protein n=1 Tax=Ancylostoma ceylanicum TaxID=53326 RepID=A0A0D6L461_9BILA|nr:hypothetical protein ANCCEY_15789 [Ancylostoma ceylanicum]